MRIISHRGNLNGRDEQRENSVEYINEAIAKGFDVEVDLWLTDTGLYIGHDNPLIAVGYNFICQPELWVHCKNAEAIDFCFMNLLNGFWHEEDKHAVTVQGYNWTYRGNKLVFNSIAVLPELMPEWDISNAWGICTDFPEKYKELYG